MITSHISGRLRFRHKELQEKSLLNETLSSLRLIQGVQSVTGNEKTGSILVCYDPSSTDIEAVKTVFSSYKEEQKHLLCGKDFCSVMSLFNESSLLRASYAATILGLFAGRRVHVWAGSAFALLSLAHMVRKSGWTFPKL